MIELTGKLTELDIKQNRDLFNFKLVVTGVTDLKHVQRLQEIFDNYGCTEEVSVNFYGIEIKLKLN